MQKTSLKGLNRNVLLDDDEKIIWDFKPKALPYIIRKNSIPWPFAIIWTLFDSIFFIAAISTGDLKEMLPMLGFLAIHMMPVWIFVGSAIKLAIEHHAIHYCITNKRVIETNSKTTVKFLFSEIDDVGFYENPISKVGIVYFSKKNKQTINFEGIKNPSKLYPTIRLIIDNQEK